MNDFKIFNEKFFNTAKEQKASLLSFLTWYDKKGVIQLGNDKVAEIVISTHGVSGEYSCYIVTIINKNSGPITSHTFLFNDYLKTRTDSRISDYSGNFKIVDHCGIDWYIAIPKDSEVKNMANTIINFIGEYKCWNH